MKFLLLFCTLCTVQGVLCRTTLLKKTQMASGSSMDGPCEYDDDCYTTNAYCKANKICTCRKGYDYDSGSDICFATRIGLRCTEDYDCSTLTNSVCQQRTCDCVGNYVVSQDGTGCFPLSRLTYACENDEQCSAKTLNSFCNATRQCTCLDGYHSVGDYSCVENRGFQQLCNNTSDCYINRDSVGTLECKQQEDERGNTNSRRCLCKDGYSTQGSNICFKDAGGGASNLVVSTTLLLFIFATFFL